jgi:hypothetical protein
MPDSSLYMPVYKLSVSTKESMQIDLIAGHGRCGADIANVLRSYGGIVPETSSTYITEVLRGQERILMAIEPASTASGGNSDWQRNSQAYSCITAGIPYLSYIVIGSEEEDGNLKALHLPNPVVPFSYLSITQRHHVFCLLVYTAHPSISDALNERLNRFFGYSDSLEAVRCVVSKTDFINEITSLINKMIQLIEWLVIERKATGTLQNDEWARWLNEKTSAEWLQKNVSHLIWKRKMTDRLRVSDTFKQLYSAVLAFDCQAVGAKDMPICLIPDNRRADFEALLKRLYPSMSFFFNKNMPLAIVWIAGFSSRGDELQSDAGMSSMARMILGNSADIMAVVYGAAKPMSPEMLLKPVEQMPLAYTLWRSIFGVCDYLLVDSNSRGNGVFLTIKRNKKANVAPVIFPYRGQYVAFSEHDTVSAIHQIFSRKEKFGVYENLCNPPGSEWEGINYFESDGNEYRCTYLLRGSTVGGKRPNHIIQIAGETENIFLSVESKENGGDLERNSGVHLKACINDFFRKSNVRQYSVVSIGAFLYFDEDEAELQALLKREKLDAVLAFEFGAKETIVHISSTQYGDFLKNLLERICSDVKGCVRNNL